MIDVEIQVLFSLPAFLYYLQAFTQLTTNVATEFRSDLLTIKRTYKSGNNIINW